MELASFTQRQTDWFRRAISGQYWFNVAEGGKRAGKNVIGALAFCTALEEHKDKIHLVAGVSIATAKLNILDCNGCGVMEYFKGRCRAGIYNNRDCLYVQTKTGEKVILISGGGKLGDEKLIKGNTYGIAYITEANECSPTFIKEVFDRTLSSSNRIIIHDLNPKSPVDRYYTEVLNYHENQQKIDKNYGFNYGHFTIADNLSISDDKLRTILKTYDKNDLWYKRDILGQRIQAEGIIYRTFLEHKDRYILKNLDDFELNSIWYGVDFGGTGSATTFVAVGLANEYRDIIVLESERHKEELSPNLLEEKYCNFISRCFDKYSIVGYTYCDSAEQVLIRGLRNAVDEYGVHTIIKNAIKMPIIDRIRLVVKLIGTGRFWVLEDAKTVIAALCNALWNSKKSDERLDDGTTDIDTLDALEYAIEPNYKMILDYME